MDIRNVRSSDYLPIITVLNDWWGGRRVSPMLPHLFFEHFNNTSFIIEEDKQVVAFLIGFLSQSQPEVAYIHFVGVHPQFRKRGYGKILYETFFSVARQNNRQIVRCITAPINSTSIAFHTRMGFRIEPGNADWDGVPYDSDYDGPGEHRVRFVQEL
jgi:ribosomal protein S18 acetylase RimI-like enzyme